MFYPMVLTKIWVVGLVLIYLARRLDRAGKKVAAGKIMIASVICFCVMLLVLFYSGRGNLTEIKYNAELLGNVVIVFILLAWSNRRLELDKNKKNNP